MAQFNVLDRNVDLASNLMLEASAGTGKTYSIETLVTRLIIESHLPLDRILVVTFTRAATRDLVARVRGQILVAKDLLEYSSPEAPDYLQAIIEQGETERKSAIRHLKNALLIFDQAPIMTIHSFCTLMMQENVFESDLRLDALKEASPLPRKRVLRAIRDCFRTELQRERYSPAQIEQLLKSHGKSMERLETTLYDLVMKGYEFPDVPDFTTLVTEFGKTMKRLHLKGQKVPCDVEKLFPFYTGLCNRQREIKPAVIQHLQILTSCFDKNEWGEEDLNRLIHDQLTLLDLLHPNNQSKKSTLTPEETEWRAVLDKELRPFVSPERVLLKLASDSHKLLQKRMREEEQLGFDDLLRSMCASLDRLPFCHKVRGAFSAVIVDEFQDTDPIQWDIFKKAFLNHVPLYLVGDPKQSIYAFRQADIYTYLAAAKSIDSKHHATLEVNYRSQPSLIDALNHLFSSAPHFISLPRIEDSLTYSKVKCGREGEANSFDSSKGAVHFMEAKAPKSRSLSLEKLEETHFFPSICREIMTHNIGDASTAVLVSDRFQAERVANALRRRGIRASLQRRESLVEAPVLKAMQELMVAVLNPSDLSGVKTVLSGCFYRWSPHAILSLDDPEILDRVLIYFESLRQVLNESGFARFFDKFVFSKVVEGGPTVYEELLSDESGTTAWSNAGQIGELVSSYESTHRVKPDHLLRFLYDFETHQQEDEESYKVRLNPEEEGVKVMTLHSSKGLEFDVVFALGLIKRTQPPSSIFPCGDRFEVAYDKEQHDYKNYCRELDAEKMRQLYVAMTRAREKLYLPVIDATDCPLPQPGQGSPMELFLQQLLPNQSLEHWVSKGGAPILYEKLEPWGDSIAIPTATKAPPLLISPESISVPGAPQFIHSFTSLSKSLPEQPHVFKDPPPHDFMAKERSSHTLPAGSQTGTLLHELLERITSVGEIEAVVKGATGGSPYEPWEKVIISMMRAAFVAPLNDFCLSDVKPLDMYKENEFLFPSNEGLLQGVIDLAFTYRGKYYLLDWKSNWLGPNSEAYSQDNLEKAMKQHHYDLQAEIYQNAFEKYLKNVIEEPFHEVFGGTFYLFLRGLNEHSNLGVYHGWIGKKAI